MKEIDRKELGREDVFDIIGQEWMLVTAGSKEKLNTMTASWDGCGTSLWRLFLLDRRDIRTIL